MCSLCENQKELLRANTMCQVMHVRNFLFNFARNNFYSFTHNNKYRHYQEIRYKIIFIQILSYNISFARINSQWLSNKKHTDITRTTLKKTFLTYITLQCNTVSYNIQVLPAQWTYTDINRTRFKKWSSEIYLTILYWLVTFLIFLTQKET